jgi:cell wall-associated NlpC family hydrolase
MPGGRAPRRFARGVRAQGTASRSVADADRFDDRHRHEVDGTPDFGTIPRVPRLATSAPALRHLALGIALSALTLSTTASAGRPADRTLADEARASLAQAATRVVDKTRDVGLFALSLVGIDYRLGGESPERGLDCSGLIRYVFQQVTGVTLPRTSRELSRLGSAVRAEDLAPGDLVFFNTRRFAFSHVGIYLGNGRFIHAPSRGGEVGVATLSNAYWQKRYSGARRLVGVLPTLMPALVAPAEAREPFAMPQLDAPQAGDANEDRDAVPAAGDKEQLSSETPTP